MAQVDAFVNQVLPLPPRYRFRDLILGDYVHHEDDRYFQEHKPHPGRPMHRQRYHRNSGVVRLSIYSDNIPPPPKVRVEFFTNEKSFKERLQLYFIKNQRSSLRIRIFNLVIKLLTCALYIVRVVMDSKPHCNAKGVHFQYNSTNDCWRSLPPEEYQNDPVINWDRILWVNRDTSLWIVQVTVAVISLAETVLVQYLSYKGNILQQIISVEFLLELLNTVPFVITIFYEPLRNMFIPVFFNVWLAKSALQTMFNDLHRVMMKSHSALAQQLMILCATIFCLLFTSICGIQHLQRGGNHQFTIIEACWFSVVTFSTVGYGDIYPDMWISQFFMAIMICAVIIILPTQVEQLAFTWMERQKQGGAYSSHRAQTEKHVVVCTTTLHSDTIMDFLNEFYAHPKLQDHFVVLLSPCELDATMKMLLQVPLWAQRVIFIQGSALKDSDLARCRVQDALACFILAARNYEDRGASDQHTILRSWAVKDFAPHCPQYVQIFRPENKFHVKFAEHVVCEDEFKYALLANNCLCPATSTLVTLLLHTSRGQEGQTSPEEWQRIYGKCSGNEVYHIRLGDSQFFGCYEGKSFTYASFHAHRRFGVSLVGIQKELPDSTIQLNPGPRHIMKKSDICFYMNITKEENTRTFNLNQQEDMLNKPDQTSVQQGTKEASRVASMIASVGSVALDIQHTNPNSESSHINRQGSRKLNLDLPKGLNLSSLQKRPSIAPVPAFLEANDIRLQFSSDVESDSDDDIAFADEDGDRYPDFIRGFPPVTPYVGTSPTLCHLLKEKRPLCCLKLAQNCDHCNYTSAKEYNWTNRAIIVCADFASNGLYNFIVPLRSHVRPKHTLNPIILLLGKEPDIGFLETICHFPMVYWMVGSIDGSHQRNHTHSTQYLYSQPFYTESVSSGQTFCLDNLLKAGINMADNVVIVNKETSNSVEEDTLSDCNTIVAVQTIFRLFPSANIITEISQATNMRFMQFRPNDAYSYTIAKLEKKEREKGSHMSYMFRLPFAAGNVFSASMLDTLLYQAFVKDYVITFTRLLLGIDQAVGSGHLACMKIKQEDLWVRTYGRLYQKLCSTTCEIPIGIYRTQIQHRGLTHSKNLKSSHKNSSMVVRDQSALNLAFRNSVIRRRPPSRSDPSEKVSISMLGLENQNGGGDNLTPERHEISQMVRCRMESLGQPVGDYDVVSEKRNTISYVIINPSYDLKLELDDVIYLIRPSSLSPQPSPLIDERRIHVQRQSMKKREEPTGADNSDIENSRRQSKEKLNQNSQNNTRRDKVVCDGQNKIPVIYMDDSSEGNTPEQSPKKQTGITDSKNRPNFHLGSTSSIQNAEKGKLNEGLSGTVV